MLIVKYLITAINSINIEDTNSACSIYHNWDILKLLVLVMVGVAIYMIAMTVSMFFMF